ncbi:hypothetical protein CRUP_028070 [Coryphaenoides rupestris]|nr:hypothetical protein CRUP_028070 [Coryphaenoides rupestris]
MRFWAWYRELCDGACSSWMVSSRVLLSKFTCAVKSSTLTLSSLVNIAEVSAPPGPEPGSRMFGGSVAHLASRSERLGCCVLRAPDSLLRRAGSVTWSLRHGRMSRSKRDPSELNLRMLLPPDVDKRNDGGEGPIREGALGDKVTELKSPAQIAL